MALDDIDTDFREIQESGLLSMEVWADFVLLLGQLNSDPFGLEYGSQSRAHDWKCFSSMGNWGATYRYLSCDGDPRDEKVVREGKR